MTPPTLVDFSYDPFAPEVMKNPLPFYRVLRDHFPLYRVEEYDLWVLSRFEDVWEMLGDTSDTFLATEGTLPPPDVLRRHNDGPVPDPPLDPLALHTTYSSEVHGSVRGTYGRMLRRGPVARMESLIRGLVTERLDVLLPEGRFDLVQDLAGIVAASVVCDMFALPRSRAREILQTVNTLTMANPVDGGVDIAGASEHIADMLMPVIAARRTADPADPPTILDSMLQFTLRGRRLRDREIALQFVGVVIGATETLPKIFGHGLMELERRPDQLRALRERPAERAPKAFEEMLRFCGPAQWFMRTVRKPVTIRGQLITPGQRIIGLLQSANRDEREFDDPDEFCWDREIPRTLAFSRGPKFCVGVHLARLEGRILVEEWLRRVASYTVDVDAAVRRPSSFQWGYTEVPVTARAA